MAKLAFKVGDIVQLKSGGPDMTVGELDTAMGTQREIVRCKWFGGRKLESGSFAPESLILSSEVEKKDKKDGGNGG
jgi:uncharacterized protein YodC (DUF2158 family)